VGNFVRSIQEERIVLARLQAGRFEKQRIRVAANYKVPEKCSI